MASITPHIKNGKIISYKFRACVGRDEVGKQVFKCTTWKIPDGLAACRVEKAAQRAAETWERHAIFRRYNLVKSPYTVYTG